MKECGVLIYGKILTNFKTHTRKLHPAVYVKFIKSEEIRQAKKIKARMTIFQPRKHKPQALVLKPWKN